MRQLLLFNEDTDINAVRIAELDLDVRGRNAVLRAGMVTAGSLIARTAQQLAQLPGCGSGSVATISKELEVFELELRTDATQPPANWSEPARIVLNELGRTYSGKHTVSGDLSYVVAHDVLTLADLLDAQFLGELNDPRGLAAGWLQEFGYGRP